MAAARFGNDLDAPAVRLGELARDRQAEAGALRAAERPGAAAEERFENRLALFCRHPGPAVDNVDRRPGIALARAHAHFAARWRELDGIADQVVHHRAQLGLV